MNSQCDRTVNQIETWKLKFTWKHKANKQTNKQTKKTIGRLFFLIKGRAK